MAFGLQNSYSGNLVTGTVGAGGAPGGGFIDPLTGRILRQPSSPMEMQAAQAEAEQYMQQQELRNYQTMLDEYKKEVPDTSKVREPFQNQIIEAITNPGLKTAEVESIINANADELAASQEADALAMAAGDAAGGFQNTGGGVQAAMAKLNSGYAGARAANARQIRTDAALAREQQRQGNLGIAQRYLDQATEQRNRVAQAMARKPVAAPQFTDPTGGLGSKMSGWSVGGGGSLAAQAASRADAQGIRDREAARAGGFGQGVYGYKPTGGTRAIGTSDTQNRRKPAAGGFGSGAFGGGSAFA